MGNYELSEDEKRILEKHKELAKQAEVDDAFFWIDDYPKYSLERKVKYWLSSIHHGMRIQGETTNDPYSEFSEKWYKYVNSKEVDFDLIFTKVVPNLGFDFNWDEYHKRIKKIN